MAAKQGLTAQLSQAGEDAKRAVLSRTGVSNSAWFSNLNTVCTIKSAPPRSPDVLQMLAIKSGWMYKRNEQHVWQARWCCVVPHMFLYYFDANNNAAQFSSSAAAAGGNSYNGNNGNASTLILPNPTAQEQEEWNAAIQNGYGNRKQHEKRSNFYLFNNQASTPAANSSTTTTTAAAAAAANHSSLLSTDEDGFPTGPLTADPSKFSGMQPAGIIDLECYTAVHRSRENQLVLELAGDDQVNPDLRAFYFCALNEQESDDWTDAFLNSRHAALQDECEAYKQVCDGFAQQLQILHTELDNAVAAKEEAQDELYRVRSHAEDTRRSCWRLLEDAMARKIAAEGSAATKSIKENIRGQVEQIRSQDMGVTAAVRVLCEYVAELEEQVSSVQQQNEKLQAELQHNGQSDQAELDRLKEEIELLRAERSKADVQWQAQVEMVTNKFQQSQKELADVQKELSSTRMEITMFQQQQKNKIQELQQHKKILKKEVIELRSSLEEVKSELTAQKHASATATMKAEQEQQKAKLLERYVEKIESQVKVQQSMMEMMSQTGSVHGGLSVAAGSRMDYRGHHHSMQQSPAPLNGNIVVVRGRESVVDPDEEQDIHVELPKQLRQDHGIMLDDGMVDDRPSPKGRFHRRGSSRRLLVDDMDNKSHVSELTEDRTQRQYFDHYNQSTPFAHHDSNNRPGARTPQHNFAQGTNNVSPRMHHSGPPSYIGVQKGRPSQMGQESTTNNAHKEQDRRPVNNNHGFTSLSSETPPPARREEIPKNRQQSSEKKLSVAQRARLEADRQCTPVRVTLDEDTLSKHSGRSRENSAGKSLPPSSNGSVTKSHQGLWRRMEEAVLGPRPDDYTSDDDSSVRSTRVTDYTDATPIDGKVTEKLRLDGHPGLAEEKKTSDTCSTFSNLSLQERSRLQRTKQLEFLRKQGLIKDENDVAGGAGVSTDAASVTSSTISPTRTTISFQGARRVPKT